MPAFDNNETAETVIGNSMNSLRKIVDRPCLLVNKLNVRKKRIWHVPRPEANAVCSSEFVPFSSHSSDLSFIKISLLSERITAYLESCSSGSSNSQKRVTPEIIMSSEIIAPSLAEQRRIGAFFDRLDSLITLHQRKYDKLCVLKKSMLDKMFPKGGSLYPEIRFAGFTDPWEQRKLGEVASKRIEKNTNGIKETFTNSAEHGIVSQLDYFDHDITNDANIGNYSVVYPDDFVYNPRISAIAPCGPINRNKLGRNGVMSPLYTVFSVDDMINKLYLEHYFTTNRWHQFMFLEGNSGARSDRFSISDSTFFEMPIQCPVLEEQELIALFFDRLDSLITLHQRKYDGCANPLFLERRISCRKPSHQNRCSATTTPSG